MKAKETIFFCHFVVIFSLSLDSCDCVEFVSEVATTTTIIYAMWRLGYPNWKKPELNCKLIAIRNIYYIVNQTFTIKFNESFRKMPQLILTNFHYSGLPILAQCPYAMEWGATKLELIAVLYSYKNVVLVKKSQQIFLVKCWWHKKIRQQTAWALVYK